ncbi:MAG: GDP-mannose 4,6-dehydratase [Patescibacteria group bacterium]
MTRNILITGGCGFIGTNAALAFAGAGNRVTLVDNFSRPGSTANAEHLKSQGITDIVTLDVADGIDALRNLLDDRSIDAVIHAAAQVAVTSSVVDPLHDFRMNALGTLHVLEAARTAAKQPFVLFTSTNKVYGGMEAVALTESDARYAYRDLPDGVSESIALDFHSPYGCSKGAADQYTRDYARIYGIPTAVFRQSCIYGKHQFGIVDQGWLAFLTMQAVFDRPITVYGDGKQVRDVLFVDDLVRAMEAAISTPEKSAGEIFNMGGGPRNTLSLLEFLAFLEKRLNKKLNVSFSDWRPGDQKVYISDVRKMEERIGWEPTTSLEEGFEVMHAWIEEHKPLLEKYL